MEKRGTGITYVKVVVNLLIMALTILCCFLVLPRIIVYFMPFFIGWIISLIALVVYLICVEYVHDRIVRQLEMSGLTEKELMDMIKEGNDK